MGRIRTQSFRTLSQPLAAPWGDVFEPLRAGTVDDMVVVGQIGQSLDGRIATATGHSKYINGPAGLDHLHRLRALVDAVVIGVGTALADDPQLTVRRVGGPASGARRDRPAGGCPPAPGCLPTTASAACWSRLKGRHARWHPRWKSWPCLLSGGRIGPRAILAALAERGLRRILIEGGADTVSRFLAAGCLDRLHVMVAPIILGAGRAELHACRRSSEPTRRCACRSASINSTTRCCSIATCRLSVSPVGRAKIST